MGNKVGTNSNAVDRTSRDYFLQLASYYIKDRLEKTGYKWENENIPVPDKGCLQVAKLAYELEEGNKSELLELMTKLPLNPQTAYPSFLTVADTIFENDTENKASWGRVMALFAWTGMLAAHCAENGMPELIPNITNWLAVYCDCHLKGWMSINYMRLLNW